MPTGKPAINGLLADLLSEVDVPEPLMVTKTITIHMPTKAQMVAYYNATDAEGRNRAIFGDHYDALDDVFADKPAQLWNVFCDRVSEHFFGSGSTQVEGK